MTVTSTVAGCGAVLGAVNTAALSRGVPPAACVVVTVNTPHVAPLQPLPLNDHDNVGSGLDPATGVSTATNDVVVPVNMLAGAVNCNVK